MKKIMFDDKYGLTQAVLEGRKTMTRRLPNKEWRDIMPGLAGEDLSHASTPFKVGEVVAVAQHYKDCVNEILVNWGHKTDITVMVFQKTVGWANKMFVLAELMPHHIRITNVRVERLQDISDDDCKREGLEFRAGWTFHRHRGVFASPREAFAALIDKISGKGTWESNPWVFVYEFELVK